MTTMCIDHFGVVVPELAPAVAWWLRALPGWDVDNEEPWNEADGATLGLTGQVVRLRGTILRPAPDAPGLEIHEIRPPFDGLRVSRRTHDLGYGHLALQVTPAALEDEGQRLARLGVAWLAEPRETRSPTSGIAYWRYGGRPHARGRLSDRTARSSLWNAATTVTAAGPSSSRPAWPRLDGSVAISGGTGAFGRAIAAAVLASGARVLLLGRRPYGDVATTLQPLEQLGEVLYRQAEASDSDAVTRAIAAADDLSAAVVNAGVSRPAPFLATTYTDWAETVRVNLTGSFIFAQAAARQLVTRSIPSAMVVVSSWAQSVPDLNNSAYSVTKAGLAMLGQCMAKELAVHDLRVNVLAAGVVDGGMAKRRLDSDPAFRARISRSVPLGRLQTLDEVASCVVWLCSAASSYVTGAVVLADGGASLGPTQRFFS